MTVALGGRATASHAMVAVRHMIRRGLRNLTVIGSPDGAGCVRKLICPYVGAEVLAPIGPFSRAAERGDIEIWECDQERALA